jgi:hypothetical protein
MSKNFLAMRGTAAPFKPTKQKGAHLPSGNPLKYSFDRSGAEKVITFLSTFLKWGLNRVFFSHCFRPQKGGGRKAVKARLYEVIG